MLNCILGMVDKTKRALAILQQRTMENAVSAGARTAAAAAASRLIASPASYASHALTPTASQQQQSQSQQQQHPHKQSQQQQSNAHSPPTAIKQMSRNDVMQNGLLASESSRLAGARQNRGGEYCHSRWPSRAVD